MEAVTQLGAVTEALSQPMCATCFTSVGFPICISGSFASAIFRAADKVNILIIRPTFWFYS